VTVVGGPGGCYAEPVRRLAVRASGWLPRPEPGSVALVTGASSGIGAEVARGLARRGHDVVLVARRQALLDRVAEDCVEMGVAALVRPCDLASAAERKALVDGLTDRGVSVAVLCNVAGTGRPAGHLVAVPVAENLALLRLNLEAVVDLCSRFAPGMVERGRGAVLNMCSMSSFAPWPAMATYAASKAGELSFTEALHTEMRAHGVAVTAVCPGFVRTDFIESAALTEAAGTAPPWVFDRAADVAEHALAAVDRNRRVAVHTVRFRAGAIALQVLPHGLVMTALDRWSPFRSGGSVASGPAGDGAGCAAD
jgi:short-subunit dehydrogenase